MRVTLPEVWDSGLEVHLALLVSSVILHVPVGSGDSNLGKRLITIGDRKRGSKFFGYPLSIIIRCTVYGTNTVSGEPGEKKRRQRESRTPPKKERCLPQNVVAGGISDAPYPFC